MKEKRKECRKGTIIIGKAEWMGKKRIKWNRIIKKECYEKEKSKT